MAMLAERKRKQRWSLNPRGKDWAEDSNKFGQKMLEKMGWSQGKGLGANENGMTEHVKISYKNDSKGMGYKESNDQWTKHEENFNSLLENLTGEKQVIDLKVSSLEKKSQTSRARVHYHKFTRGKDLSRYSEKDLANIFGKKSLKEQKKSISKDEENETQDACDVKGESSSFMFHGGSMTEYFKKKLGNFGKNSHGYVIGNDGVLRKDDSGSESDIRNFGFGFSSFGSNDTTEDKRETENNEAECQDTLHIKESEVKSKKKRNKNSFVSYVEENVGESGHISVSKSKKRKIEECNEEPNTTKPKKIKKYKKVEENSGCVGVSNPAFDPLRTPIKIEKHILNPIEENEESFFEEKGNSTPECSTNGEEINAVNSEECLKKLKKKSKKKKVSEAIVGVENEVFTDQIADEESSRIEIEENPYEIKIGNKKKKKKDKKEKIEDNFAIVNPNFSLNDSEEISTINEEKSKSLEEFEVKRKNKKSKKKKIYTTEEEITSFAIENPVFGDLVEEDKGLREETSSFEVKRKSKKNGKKKKGEEIEENKGLENPALNLSNVNNSTEESINFDLMLNVTNEETIEDTSTNAKVVNERFTITKVNTLKRRKSVRFSDVNEEYLIPNNEELQELEQQENDPNNSEETIFDIQLNTISSPQIKENNSEEINKKKFKKNKRQKYEKGIANNAFDTQTNLLEENVDTISKTLEKYQSEIENDINEKRAMETNDESVQNGASHAIKTVEIDDVMVGEVGNPHGENAQLPDGSVKLKFKNAKFGKTAWYVEGLMGPRKSYKHLIKGDIVVEFKESNLHQIDGYASSQGVRETAV